MTTTITASDRPVATSLRNVFLTPWLWLTVYPFVTLFLVPGLVGQFFPWPVASPLTAATLGAAYGSALALFGLGLLARHWPDVRLIVYASFVQLSLMLATTLTHLGQLRLAGGPVFAFFSSWVWLASHLAAPPLLLVLILVQLRAPGADRRRPEPMPLFVSLPSALLGVVTGVAGLALFLLPDVAGRVWPWPVAGIDAQALGTWLISFGVASFLALREADLYRIYCGLASYAVFGGLGLVALARYAGDLRPGSPSPWIYGAVLVLIALNGLTGLAMAGPPARFLGRGDFD